MDAANCAMKWKLQAETPKTRLHVVDKQFNFISFFTWKDFKRRNSLTAGLCFVFNAFMFFICLNVFLSSYITYCDML